MNVSRLVSASTKIAYLELLLLLLDVLKNFLDGCSIVDQLFHRGPQRLLIRLILLILDEWDDLQDEKKGGGRRR